MIGLKLSQQGRKASKLENFKKNKNGGKFFFFFFTLQSPMDEATLQEAPMSVQDDK
jgi:hypothetical protein